jgi:hypothetical protein
MAAKKIDIFGSAKEKTSASSKTSDKEVVYVSDLEEKLLEFDALKAQIADLESELGAVKDEITNISKEKFVELYQQKKANPKTFLIKDGEGCVMVVPNDKYISLKDEDRVNELIEKYGEDVVTIDEKYIFNTEVLQRNMETIQKLIGNSKAISDYDKENLLVNEVKYTITKGTIDNLAKYGKKIGNVVDDIQPVIVLKNCGGKMEEGGEVATDVIGLVYTKR